MNREANQRRVVLERPYYGLWWMPVAFKSRFNVES